MTDLPHPPAPAALRTEDGRPLQLHRIFCVGRNYADHAREMGHDPEAEPPFFFMKPASAAVPSDLTLPFPAATGQLEHEAELAVLLGAGGADIEPAQAEALIWGCAAANDLTRRDLQAQAKAARRPWDMAKGFDASCILGPLREGPMPGPEARITCDVDGIPRQEGALGQMIWPVSHVIAHLSRLVTLQPGDLILTGTPAGVGPIAPGQSCRVTIEGLEEATVTYA
ncbi:fumarylacetoacetate hydrolase family protein [Pseudoroseicyclus aestuarii]|uniref:Fumarylpyruvate hydrolase n=1 Tax=Pseudoroseicyclus aestuarii TaxID=1795041 RepID=A0A318SZ17_9RHOB|nr:fumarylacetoacetate hydrolase family protein [Pseudoroseicyclus aestuarii]PYE85007.1 fumarylpyruvate hydrolase [Pseudoroseicyclus aestuarii]